MTATKTELISNDSKHASLLPDVALLGVATFWGLNIPLMKIGLDEVNIYVFNAVRLTLSAVVLLAFAGFERKRNPNHRKMNVRWHAILLYGLLVGALYQVLFLLGISRTTSGNTALIIATVPMWTALLAKFFLGERLRIISWLGLLVGVTGTVIVALQKDDITADRSHLLGNVTVLAAAVVWSAGTVYSRPLLKQITPLQLASASAVISVPIHICVACWWGDVSHQSVPAWPIWLIILYSGSLSSGLSQPMWHYGVRHAGASHASGVQNLIPLIAILAAWGIRGEAATPAQILGGALILGGLVTMRFGR